MSTNGQLWCIEHLVLQPTTLCNLNCAYCYLPDRQKALVMSPAVTQKVADSLSFLDFTPPLGLIWHGGEPLLTGKDHFRALLQPFEALRKQNRISHYIQTNATHVDDEWCQLFNQYGIEIGLSIDGPMWATRNRVDWNGTESFERILGGIHILKSNGIKFSAIAVVTKDTFGRAKEFYEFFCELGCTSLGINIEEKIGIHQGHEKRREDVARFWDELFEVWQKDLSLEIRELRYVLSWMNATVGGNRNQEVPVDIFPTIGWNGDVVLLSPELLGATAVHGNFVIGNVLHEELVNILERGKKSSYVTDYLLGIERCESTCQYFSYCRGGQAANKLFELGSAAGTETAHCRESKQQPLESVLAGLEQQESARNL